MSQRYFWLDGIAELTRVVDEIEAGLPSRLFRTVATHDVMCSVSYIAERRKTTVWFQHVVVVADFENPLPSCHA